MRPESLFGWPRQLALVQQQDRLPCLAAAPHAAGCTSWLPFACWASTTLLPSSHPPVPTGSARLALLVSSTVGQALRVMSQKAEFTAASGPDLRAVGGACNAAQLRNIALCNCLQEVGGQCAC